MYEGWLIFFYAGGRSLCRSGARCSIHREMTIGLIHGLAVSTIATGNDMLYVCYTVYGPKPLQTFICIVLSRQSLRRVLDIHRVFTGNPPGSAPLSCGGLTRLPPHRAPAHRRIHWTHDHRSCDSPARDTPTLPGAGLAGAHVAPNRRATPSRHPRMPPE